MEVIVLRFGSGNDGGLSWAEERAGNDADEAGDGGLHVEKTKGFSTLVT